MTKTFLPLIVLTVSTTLAPQVLAQVQTEVQHTPPVVSNAKAGQSNESEFTAPHSTETWKTTARQTSP